MNRKQLASIEALTSNMVINCPAGLRDRMNFNIEATGSGFIVNGITDVESLGWTEYPFQAIAYVGPQGGIKRYKEFH